MQQKSLWKSLKVFRLKAAILGLWFVKSMMFNCGNPREPKGTSLGDPCTVGIFSLKWYGNDRKINCFLDWFQYLYLVNYYWAAKNPYSKYQLMLKKWYKILIFSWILCLSLPGKPELAKFGKIRLATSTRRSIEIR